MKPTKVCGAVLAATMILSNMPAPTIMAKAPTTIVAKSSASDKKAAKKVVKQYFDALNDGDLEKAKTYYSDSVNDDSGVAELDETLSESLEDLGLGDGFNDSAKEFMTNTVKNFFREYEIEKVSMVGNTAKVTVTVTGVDEDALDFDSYEDEVDELMNTYIDENTARIQQLIDEKGEDEAQQVVITELSQKLFEFLNQKVNDADSTTYTYSLKLKKQGGSWKITKIESESIESDSDTDDVEEA